jgi:dynein light intermediate chain 1
LVREERIAFVSLLILSLIVVGDSGCGKSTLIHYLKNDPGPQPVVPETDSLPPSSFNVSASNNYTPMPNENLDDDVANNLALGYTFVDIQDEENEGNQQTNT